MGLYREIYRDCTNKSWPMCSVWILGYPGKQEALLDTLVIPAGVQEVCHNVKSLKDGSQDNKACPIGRVYPKKDT